MADNRLELSADRMELKIYSPSGQLATVHSRCAEGFTDAALDYARTYQFKLQRGQIKTTWRFPVKGKTVYLHKGSGPPTWWIPKIKISRNEIMLGWLRRMIAVAVFLPEKECCD